MLKDDQKKILELLEELEMNVSNIYKLFANKFPSQLLLWSDLSDEEKKHSEYIRRLNSFAQEGKVNFSDKMTNPYAIKLIVDNIKSIYLKTENDQYSVINALSFSLSLEQSIIEHKFYNFFSSNDPEAAEMLKTIQRETLAHESKVKNALETETKQR